MGVVRAGARSGVGVDGTGVISAEVGVDGTGVISAMGVNVAEARSEVCVVGAGARSGVRDGGAGALT